MKFQWFVGIDISKKTLDATLFANGSNKKSPHKQFINDGKGHQALVNWLNNQGVSMDKVLFCMEHTGVYGLSLAVFMEKNDLVYTMVSLLHIKRSLGHRNFES
jgi:transposase